MSYNLDLNKDFISASFDVKNVEYKKYNDPLLDYRDRMEHLSKEIESTYRKLQRLEEIQQLRKMKYADYLKSEYFQNFRLKVLKSRRYKCERCKGKYRLQIHHKHYASLGNEKLNDVMVLCITCHERMHFTL